MTTIHHNNNSSHSHIHDHSHDTPTNSSTGNGKDALHHHLKSAILNDHLPLYNNQHNHAHNNFQNILHNGLHNLDSSIPSSKTGSPSILSSRPSNLTSTFTSTTSLKNLQTMLSTYSSSNSLTNLNLNLSTRSAIPMDNSGESLKLVIVCVGLPARGKSYITKKLMRYLNWMQFNTKIFNVGNTRRQEKGKPSDVPIQGPTINDEVNIPNYGVPKTHTNTHTNTSTSAPTASDSANGEKEDGTSHDANFFDPNNTDNFHRREQWARETLDSLLEYLTLEDGNVGIFDATNTTKARRRWIVETINQKTKGSIKILFLESVCDDQELLEKNIRLKLSGPDYKKMDRQLALDDFRNRLKNYEKVYETIDNDEERENEKFDIQYVKIINAGKKVVSYNISGFLSSQCVFFLLNFNLSDRQIWLTTNGESEFNLSNRKGGDSSLSSKGWAFAKALPKFISKKREEFKLNQLNKEFVNDESSFHTKPHLDQKFNIWTSNLKRSLETASYFANDSNNNNHNNSYDEEYHFDSFRMLNDLSCGSMDSVKEDDFRLYHAEEYKNQLTNKLSYRFPGIGGESYLDVIARLRPIIIELERLKDHVLLISHRVITRVLLCYFMNLNKEMLTELDVQHGFVYCVEPKPYGLDLKIWQYDEVTDNFYEVDEIELMKKKRKRVSISIGENYKPLLMTHQISSSNDNSNHTTDDESSSDEDEAWSDIKAFRKRFMFRTNSQAYEFATVDGGRETVTESASGSGRSSASTTPGNNTPHRVISDYHIRQNGNGNANANGRSHSHVYFETPVKSNRDLDAEAASIMQDPELLEKLKKLLQVA
ncbi:unnamed protein product [Ambrosiozyma monospora]|uniref:Unnamed protein product n=1 Tax=Ambrosiozyma monospora TaxID=43982 RepID=A0A9W6YSG1_AMBMO|nr:unnamed protein product [Ambrosiozyma monospora]